MNVGLHAVEARKLLAIYLRDHLAGSAGGFELARRCLGSNRGTPLGEFLADLVTQIAEDRRVLEDVMSRLGVAPDPVKLAAAAIAERVARLKLNGSLFGYSALSRVTELEGLHAGINLKLRLWLSLRALADDDPRLAGIDFEHLVERARTQLDQVEQHRLAATTRAFAGP